MSSQVLDSAGIPIVNNNINQGQPAVTKDGNAILNAQGIPEQPVNPQYASRIQNDDSSTQQTPTGAFPTTGISSNNPSTLDFASRTISYVNGLPQMGYNIFSFHNSVKDLLMNGTLSGYDMTNVNSFMSTLPSDWKSKFTANEDGLADLFKHVTELSNMAHSLWPQGSESSTPSGWYSNNFSVSTQQTPYNDWTKQASQDPYSIHNQTSLTNNSGTEKDGYSDHPDYVGIAGELWAAGKGFQSGMSALESEASMSSAGEAAFGSMEGVVGEGMIIGEEGLLASAGAETAAGIVTAVGMATGVGEVALAIAGVAAIGYGLYKMSGGGENNGFMDKVTSGFSKTLDFFGL